MIIGWKYHITTESLLKTRKQENGGKLKLRIRCADRGMKSDICERYDTMISWKAIKLLQMIISPEAQRHTLHIRWNLTLMFIIIGAHGQLAELHYRHQRCDICCRRQHLLFLPLPCMLLFCCHFCDYSGTPHHTISLFIIELLETFT